MLMANFVPPDVIYCIVSAKHKIVPTIEKVEFEDFPKAYQKLEHGRPHYRMVVDVQSWAKKHGFDK